MSTEPDPPEPPRIDGFEITRSLSRGRWAAVETSLGRPVALLPLATDTFRASDWPDDRGVPRLYGLVDSAAGRFVVTQWRVELRTLTECRAAGSAGRGDDHWLDEAARIVSRAPHGHLTSDDILIDDRGRVFVTGFGLLPAPAAGDHDVIEALRQRAGHHPWPAWLIALEFIAVIGVVALSVVWMTRLDDAVPPPTGVTYGSDLSASGMDRVDCELRATNLNSPTCTLMQQSLPGHRLRTRPGTVRQWVVRGVRGRVVLQVIRPTADGWWQAVAETDPVTIDDPETVRVIPVRSLIYEGQPQWPRHVRKAPRVPAGARFGLRLSPGTSVGVRSGVGGASLSQFLGPVTFLESSRPTRRPGTGEELMLRVDVDPVH